MKTRTRKWNKQTGRLNIRKYCGNSLPGACPTRRSPTPSMQSSAPAIRAMPRSDAPNGWVLRIRTGRSRRRARASRSCTGCWSAARPNPRHPHSAGQCQILSAPRQSRFAASRSIRATSLCWNSNARIADILTAAMRRERPLRFVGIRAARVRVIARPIFI